MATRTGGSLVTLVGALAAFATVGVGGIVGIGYLARRGVDDGACGSCGTACVHSRPVDDHASVHVIEASALPALDVQASTGAVGPGAVSGESVPADAADEEDAKKREQERATGLLTPEAQKPGRE